jgi:hypothetical protein
MDSLPARGNIREINNSRDGRKNRVALSNLREAVVDNQYSQMWPTPDANCGNRGPAKDPKATHRPSGAQRQMTINDAVKMWPTPTSRMHKDNGKSPSELNRNSETLATKAGGQLSPQWVEWLMGFPDGWTDLED